MPTVDESGLRKRIGAGELSGLFVVAGRRSTWSSAWPSS